MTLKGAMGEVTPLARAEFFFDLACPFTYLVAERVDRRFAGARWTPAAVASRPVGLDRLQGAAAVRAAALRLPLVWPERFPARVPAAMRLAAYATERGRGAAFALAATRLAFSGGFDLEDPEILADAAAAAGLPVEHGLRAAYDRSLQPAIEAAGIRLLAAGAVRTPALRLGRVLLMDERRIGEAAAAWPRAAAAWH